MGRTGQVEAGTKGGVSEELYAQLRRVAAKHLRQEGAAHTLQPTALVHEAYVRLADQEHSSWKSQTHFLAVASKTMRRILVDHARKRRRLKRGGNRLQVTLSTGIALELDSDMDLCDLDEVLDRLAVHDARAARVVEMTFFGGLSQADIAAVLGVSERTVQQDWAHARAWLLRELSRQHGL